MAGAAAVIFKGGRARPRRRHRKPGLWLAPELGLQVGSLSQFTSNTEQQEGATSTSRRQADGKPTMAKRSQAMAISDLPLPSPSVLGGERVRSVRRLRSFLLVSWPWLAIAGDAG